MRTTRLSLLLIWLALTMSVQGQVTETAFDPSQLTVDGKKDFETLLNVNLFALGGTGYGGEISSGELALRELVQERHATAALRQLVSTANAEGGLYALLGLKLLKCDCIGSEYERFLSLPELEAKTNKGWLPTKKGFVRRMAGCIGFQEARTKVARDILEGSEEIDWAIKHWPAFIPGN